MPKLAPAIKGLALLKHYLSMQLTVCHHFGSVMLRMQGQLILAKPNIIHS